MKKREMVHRNLEIKLINLFNIVARKKRITYIDVIRDFFNSFNNHGCRSFILGSNIFYHGHYNLDKLLKPLEFGNYRFLPFIDMINVIGSGRFVIVKCFTDFDKEFGIPQYLSEFVNKMTEVGLFDFKITDKVTCMSDTNKEGVRVFYEMKIPIIGEQPLIRKIKVHKKIEIGKDPESILKTMKILSNIRNNMIDRDLIVLKRKRNGIKVELDSIDNEIKLIENKKIRL